MLNRINLKILSYHRNRCCQKFQHFCISSISARIVERRRDQQFYSHSILQSMSSESSLISSDEQVARCQHPFIDTYKIDEKRAMFDYILTRSHLQDLPVAEKHTDPEVGRIFYLADVQTKALIIHGEETLRAMMRGETIKNRKGQLIRPPGTILKQKLRPSDTFTISGQFTKFYHKIFGGNESQENGEEEHPNTPEQANKVVLIAMGTNLIDFLMKASAAYLTSSKSLYAEAIHSSLDFLNQCILYFGNRESIRKPNSDFPYGYGNAQYLFSMLAGVGIFTGGGFSIYNGGSGLYSHFWLGTPAELESLSLGLGLLSVSFILQLYSFTRARQEIKKRLRKEGSSLKQLKKYFAIADPSLRLIYYEDRASLIGVSIAFISILTTNFMGWTFADSVGSIAIGGLLCHAAWTIMYTNYLHLLGRSLPPEKKKEFEEYMKKYPIVRNLHDVKATYHGPNDYRFKAEIDYNGQELSRIYLEENYTKEALQKEFEEMKSGEDLEEFLMNHGDKLIEKMGDEVNRLEYYMRREFPQLRHMDLEPN